MNLQDFIKEYNGKFVEVGGSQDALNQCVDLANKWLINLGFQPVLGTNAVDFSKHGNDKLKWITSGNPQSGDLVVWNIGTVGHIAIFIDGTLNNFNSFDQNYPLKSACHIQRHDNKNVIGWLHPEGVNMDRKQIYRATQGREPSDRELADVAGLTDDQLIEMRFKDDVIGGYWKVSNGDECPLTEKDIWANKIRIDQTIDSLEDTWYHDHVQKRLDALQGLVDASNAQITQLQTELDAEKTRTAQLQQTSADALTKISELNAEKDDANNALVAEQVINKQLQAKLDSQNSKSLWEIILEFLHINK